MTIEIITRNCLAQTEVIGSNNSKGEKDMALKIEFIRNAGGCIVSNNILSGQGKLKWLFREEPVNKDDNGWRFFSEVDDDKFINSPENLTVCDFNTVAEIEPAILGIYHFPIGSDMQLIRENGEISFSDNKTGKKVNIV
jgi:hypothetical protein